MSNEIQTIVKWFSDAKPNPTIEDAFRLVVVMKKQWKE